MEENMESERAYVPKAYNRGEPRKAGNKPDYRVVQPETDKDGGETLNNVGGMWLNKSKDGKEYANLKIGNARFVCFRSEGKSKTGKDLPAWRVCQHERDEKGESALKSVGAMWENVSKDKKKVFYNLKFGEMRLLVFKNE